MKTLSRFIILALMVFGGACVLPATVGAQATAESDLYIQQVPVTGQNDSRIEPWNRTAGGHMDNFDTEELRQRMMSLFGQGWLHEVTNLGLIGQWGDDHVALVEQRTGSGNHAVIVQSNRGAGSGFNPPGKGNPNPPPFVGSEAGGNRAEVLQSGSDHWATILQGVIEGEQSGSSSSGNSDTTPPPFESDGSGDYTAHVVQEGDEHTATIIQSGTGFVFDPPGNGTGNESPPPFDGDGYGGSSADIAQYGSENTGLIVQFGNEHLAEIFQNGLQNLGEIWQSGQMNTGDISQDGQENRGIITQEGDYNKAMMRLVGNFNDIKVGQFGNYNIFNLDLTGDSNFLDLTQNGDHNTYDREFDRNAVLNETIMQNGNGNNAMQIGTLSNGRSANILQEGSGMEVIIRHEH